jgi:hypothetical protein
MKRSICFCICYVRMKSAGQEQRSITPAASVTYDLSVSCTSCKPAMINIAITLV